MQEKTAKISEIKGRFLQFLDTQNVSVYKFSTESGISKSQFSGKSLESELGGSQISEILTHFPELNSDWLLTGKGEMLRPASQTVGNISHSTAVGVNVNGNDINISYDPLLPTVESLSDSVARLTAQNAQLLGELSRLISIVEKKIC